ncbi:extracellular solute-binding protein [Nesterenkonia alba]|uniref:extracellular solute-binding protein n=1 Tax=Nesterenkonia alba TaxID=515814 RepID=UPI0003B4B2E3|nr:extracellular solute-binding protein [Nesterenkonia alba]
MTGSRPRVAATAMIAALALTGCGETDDTPVLTWYINPDDGGQAALAEQCTDEADGEYIIQTSLLPNDAPAQREQLARRLAAGDSSLDIMSVDLPFIPEFAEPGFLAPVPDDVAENTTEDTLDGPLEAATWGDELVAIPFTANPQLLWYRESVAEEAGLDMDEPVTWDDIIDAARETDTYLGIQGVREESMTVWVNALIASQGETILADEQAEADQLQPQLGSEAGQRAAEIISTIGSEGLAGPGVASLDEEQGMRLFQGDNGSFMVNWPFVWPATNAAVEGGDLDEEVLDDIGWAQYPRVEADTESAPPLGGVALAVGAESEHPDLAYQAVECIVQPENQADYFLTDGLPPSSDSAYADDRFEDEFPMAEDIREAIDNAAPRPQTPFYNEVSEGIQSRFTPISGIDPETTGEQTDTFIQQVLRGERLL